MLSCVVAAAAVALVSDIIVIRRVCVHCTTPVVADVLLVVGLDLVNVITEPTLLSTHTFASLAHGGLCDHTTFVDNSVVIVDATR